MKENQGKI